MIPVQTADYNDKIEVLGIVHAVDRGVYDDYSLGSQILNLEMQLRQNAIALGATHVVGVHFIPHVSNTNGRNILRAIGTAIREVV